VFCDDENLATNDKIVEGTKGAQNFFGGTKDNYSISRPQLELNLTFCNASNSTFYSADKVGIICSNSFHNVYGKPEVVSTQFSVQDNINSF
jgi:hypothetical protein